MKYSNDQWNGKTNPGREEPPHHEPDPREPKKFPEPKVPGPQKPRINPYPWFPAIAEGKPGAVYISYIIVYYSLN